MKNISASDYERYAILCELAYPSVFNHKLYGYEEQTMIHDRFGRAFGRVLWNAAEVVLLFRGTRDFFADWYTNIRVFPKRVQVADKKCFVHGGFIDALGTYDKSQSKPAFEYLVEILTPLLRSDRRFVITGHSLGGALAVLGAAKLSGSFPGRINAVFTFGQPAVGGDEFRKAYPLKEITHRVCAGIDIVTFLPGPFFRHVGRQLWIHDGIIHQDVHWATRILKTLRLAAIRIVADHSMRRYVAYKHLFERDVK